jgi:hypothetical protein
MYAYQEEPSSRLPFPHYQLIPVHRPEKVWSAARPLSLNRPDCKARLLKDYNLDEGLLPLSDQTSSPDKEASIKFEKLVLAL